MKLEECCGATNVRRTNVLCTNLFEECQRRILREGPLDEGNFVAKVFDEASSTFNSTPNALEYRVGGRSREGNRDRRMR